jgi:cell wall-associated NlpC family hydrolase
MWPNKFKHTRFKERGRDYDGVDCYGVVYLIYRDLLGIALPSFADQYRSTEDAEDIAALIAGERQRWVEVDQPQEFDLVLIRLKGMEMHVGVYHRDGWFVHCLTGAMVATERITSPVWRHRITGYFRYVG